MNYSNFTHPFYHHPINTTPSPLHPTYIPPFYSTNTPLTTPSPNMCFNHGYTPPSFQPPLNIYSSPSPSNPYYSSATTAPSPSPNYHSYPPPSNAHIYGYTNNIPSPNPDPYPSYSTFSNPNPENCNYNQQQVYHSYQQPVATASNVEIVKKKLTEILEFIKKFKNEMTEDHLAFKEDLKASEEIFYEQMQASKLSHKATLHNLFDKSQTLQNKLKDKFVEETQEKDKEGFVGENEDTTESVKPVEIGRYVIQEPPPLKPPEKLQTNRCICPKLTRSLFSSSPPPEPLEMQPLPRPPSKTPDFKSPPNTIFAPPSALPPELTVQWTSPQKVVVTNLSANIPPRYLLDFQHNFQPLDVT
jgi:hypothetical protein